MTKILSELLCCELPWISVLWWPLWRVWGEDFISGSPMANSQERMAASYSCFTHAPSCVKDTEQIQKIQPGSDRCKGIDYAQSQQKDNKCKALPQSSSSASLKCSSHTWVNSSFLALLRGGQSPVTCCPLRKTGAEGESKVLIWGLTHEQKMSLLTFSA